jgi:hypothetical protein
MGPLNLQVAVLAFAALLASCILPTGVSSAPASAGGVLVRGMGAVLVGSWALLPVPVMRGHAQQVAKNRHCLPLLGYKYIPGLGTMKCFPVQ